ncbi:transketolase [Desulfovibrio inopinatus]|uniref:transketolase n=1 Tax=Desulfovibrio inopinatus TaxID=102109 RepID=UPI000402EF83|nr:transketolase [Desulfovibrio inopinatus]
MDTNRLSTLARLIRRNILISSTTAGSGHPTSSLSATDLMTGLFFGSILRFDPSRPGHPGNDRVIFSKGHASPLFYALWAAAGAIQDEELKTFRAFGSPLEGHPTARFPLAEAATGSLGQGLSIGAGMALCAKYLENAPTRTYVLLGDSEMAEGSVWEAIQLAVHYKLNNLIAILDVNRLGQRGETMYGHNVTAYDERVRAFGWETCVIDGHDMDSILNAYARATAHTAKVPFMIIAKTIKGKGVPFAEDLNGWHGKPIPKDRLNEALTALGEVPADLRGNIAAPLDIRSEPMPSAPPPHPSYSVGEPIATRKAYGEGLVRIADAFPDMVVLDAEVSNSTYADTFKKAYPNRFFEMYIAEQNMVGMALGLSRRGRLPFVSTFGAFFTRAFDQIRMSRYSGANIIFCGSHAGVSIGEDGPSQMGLEDIAMFRSVLDSVVLYPSDAVSCVKLTEAAAEYGGIVYIRTTRGSTPVLYDNAEYFPIGGFKILRQSDLDVATIIGAGLTVHEALAAWEELKQQNISVRVIDLYCVKPLDGQTLAAAASQGPIITVEDHGPTGGLGEAVSAALANTDLHVVSLAVSKMPMSGTPDELLNYETISRTSIVKKVQEIV